MRTSLPEFVKKMRPGEQKAYHLGYLPVDRANNPEIDREARQAWQEYEAGRVSLTQQKLADGIYAYIMEKRK